MTPWILLDTATVPGGGGELRLMRRGDEYSIMAGPITLMNSRLHGSEESLAALTLARIANRKAPRLLIGGLGMGFTLRAALAIAPKDARIVVAELLPAVVEWAKGPMAPVFGDCLDDPRVQVAVEDVSASIGKGPYDAILLDVDNGPEGLTRAANDALYDASGLARAKAALTPSGVLSVWSSAPHAGFTKRLAAAGFRVEEARVPARRGGGRGAKHVIWLAVAG